MELKNWPWASHAMMAALPDGWMLDGALHDPKLPNAAALAYPLFVAWLPMSVRSIVSLVFSTFIAAMLGLAAGALWMVVTVYQRQPMPWLVLPVAAILAWAIRNSVRKPGNVAAALAALATLLAEIYVSMLIAAAQIAGSMGLGIVDTLLTAGTGMLWQLARIGFSTSDVVWTLLAMLLAAWLGLRPLPIKKQRK